MRFFHPLGRRFALLPHSVQGALYMTLAGFFFALMNTCVRYVGEAQLHPTEIAFFRNFFAFLFMLPWLFSTRLQGLRTKRLGAHLWRAVVGVFSMFFWFAAVAALPLAQAVALNFTFPLFGTILAALVLKEDVRLRRWSATVVGFLGVLVILQPWTATVEWSSALPVIAALLMAMSATFVKSLSRTETPGTMVFYMNFFMTPLALIPAAFFWIWPDWRTLGFLIVLGFFAAVSHIMLTRAYAIADASAVQPFDYLRLPFIAGIGYLLFDEVPDIWLWIGAAIIAASTIYIAHREAQVARVRAVKLKTAETPKELP
jgi:drug/metabolite transporter (DMT)-like permease